MKQNSSKKQDAWNHLSSDIYLSFIEMAMMPNLVVKTCGITKSYFFFTYYISLSPLQYKVQYIWFIISTFLWHRNTEISHFYSNPLSLSCFVAIGVVLLTYSKHYWVHLFHQLLLLFQQLSCRQGVYQPYSVGA